MCSLSAVSKVVMVRVQVRKMKSAAILEHNKNTSTKQPIILLFHIQI